MSELNTQQKNKILAAADIVEKGDMAVLRRILDFQDIVEDTKIEVDKKLLEIDSKIDSSDEYLKSECEATCSKLEEMSGILEIAQTKIDEFIDAINSKQIQDINSLTEKVSTELIAIKTLIPSLIPVLPEMPNLQALEDKIVSDFIQRLEAIRLQIPVFIPDTPEVMRDKLESLELGEKLVIDAIEGLREALDKLEKKKTFTMFGGSNGGSSGGRAVRAYDLTSQLNGVTKTFNLPATWRVISVHSSSFPGSFRETVDYTWTAQTITFTDQIDAGSTLSTNQTLTIIYVEP